MCVTQGCIQLPRVSRIDAVIRFVGAVIWAVVVGLVGLCIAYYWIWFVLRTFNVTFAFNFFGQVLENLQV